jgi:hypothetical protein
MSMFFAAAPSDDVTGQVLFVDGGFKYNRLLLIESEIGGAGTYRSRDALRVLK